MTWGNFVPRLTSTYLLQNIISCDECNTRLDGTKIWAGGLTLHLSDYANGKKKLSWHLDDCNTQMLYLHFWNIYRTIRKIFLTEIQQL